MKLPRGKRWQPVCCWVGVFCVCWGVGGGWVLRFGAHPSSFIHQTRAICPPARVSVRFGLCGRGRACKVGSHVWSCYRQRAAPRPRRRNCKKKHGPLLGVGITPLGPASSGRWSAKHCCGQSVGTGRGARGRRVFATLTKWFSLTRLETRTKESNIYASIWVANPDAK